MLFYLAELSPDLSLFNVFRYITFRAGGAFITALIFGFLFGRPLIDLLRLRQGLFVPGSVGVPFNAAISSAERSST